MNVLISQNNIQTDKKYNMVISPAGGYNILNINEYLADYECSSITCDCLDYVRFEFVESFILCLLNKIEQGGKETLSGGDANLLIAKLPAEAKALQSPYRM